VTRALTSHPVSPARASQAQVETEQRLQRLERAVERAALLEKPGRAGTPVVGGWPITAEEASLARERGVWQALDGRVTPRRRF
jgi:hypothetical protein